MGGARFRNNSNVSVFPLPPPRLPIRIGEQCLLLLTLKYASDSSTDYRFSSEAVRHNLLTASLKISASRSRGSLPLFGRTNKYSFFTSGQHLSHECVNEINQNEKCKEKQKQQCSFNYLPSAVLDRERPCQLLFYTLVNYHSMTTILWFSLSRLNVNASPRLMHWASDGTTKLPQEFLNQNFAYESSASGYQDAPVHVHFPDAIFVGIVSGDGCHFVGVYLVAIRCNLWNNKSIGVANKLSTNSQRPHYMPSRWKQPIVEGPRGSEACLKVDLGI